MRPVRHSYEETESLALSINIEKTNNQLELYSLASSS